MGRSARSRYVVSRSASDISCPQRVYVPAYSSRTCRTDNPAAANVFPSPATSV
ncbi:hypothetical protein WKI71_24240 [Streptomyces sp. MS1.AVA.1]|uniref:Uncharacterized protein n=1 Tax=Streptomyces machairae TaxID=3134109 RepID=A0ABU8UNF7_9ACTN